jgi:hypothetical protein
VQITCHSRLCSINHFVSKFNFISDLKRIGTESTEPSSFPVPFVLSSASHLHRPQMDFIAFTSFIGTSPNATLLFSKLHSADTLVIEKLMDTTELSGLGLLANFFLQVLHENHILYDIKIKKRKNCLTFVSVCR